MKIAFYAPLKSPEHPTPSGDRQMARMLIKALELAGHQVDVASSLRSFMPEPSPAAWAGLAEQARQEISGLSARWPRGAKPDVWFTYHPYYKAPDLLGPALARSWGIPYVTAEASYSARRNAGAWRESQARVVDCVRLAAANFCFTNRDRKGLAEAAPDARIEMLPPFIDTSPFQGFCAADNPGRLIAVAMMRRGDKYRSFAMLASALGMIVDLPWTLSVAGGGDLRGEIEALFNGFPRHRIEWLGQLPPQEIASIYQEGGIYVWPGCGEAYGLAYLEAQAAGLPVVAQETAGVPEVVRNGVTGLLTPDGDVAAYAAAVRMLITHGIERRRMAAAARKFVLDRHALGTAAATLSACLDRVRGTAR